MKGLRTILCVLVFALILQGCGGSKVVVTPTRPARPTRAVPPTETLPPTPTATPASTRPENPQIGLNFIRFFDYETPGRVNLQAVSPDIQATFDDFDTLGVQVYRQLIKADLLWDAVEPRDDQWNFEVADAVLKNPDYEPIVTLFSMQFASPTPPWVTDPAQFEKTLGPEAEEYLDQIISRYGQYIKYWEIGNEMDHWIAADPGSPQVAGGGLPDVIPPDGFSPQEQGIFLAQTAAYIRAHDPDAVIVMPGMSDHLDYGIHTWLAGVIESSGTDWFDVVNYHYYRSWSQFPAVRLDLQEFLSANGISNKPVWLTETGASSSPTLTLRTNYPNSQEAQAADIFRRILQAYGAGDDLVIWHTHVSSPDESTNDWRLYGIRDDQKNPQLSYYTYKLLTDELIPFVSVETISNNPLGINAYKITTGNGEIKYVAWGTGTYAVPVGVTQMTSVVPDADGSFSWQAAAGKIALTLDPVLLK